jgi:hypothetical protein
VQKFPPVVSNEINTEILEQIVKIGFDEAEVRKRLAENQQCQEVTMYNLMLYKWQSKDQQVPRLMNGEPSDLEEPLYGRRRGDSMPARPDFKEPIPIEDIKTGTRASEKFHKAQQRKSTSFKSTSAASYGNGEMNNLEALAKALSTSAPDSTSSLSSTSSPSNSPSGPSSPIQIAANKRNTMDPHHYKTNGHEGSSSRPVLGSTSPPSPMRPRSPNPSTTNNGSGTQSPTAANNKRKSLILNGIESAFKSFMKERSEPRMEKPDKAAERAERVDPVPESRRRSSTIVGMESAFKNLFGGDKVKQVSGVFNVDTTTTIAPQQVIEEIKRVLDIESADGGDFQLEYKLKAYTFKCSYPNRRLKFNLEICRIKNLDLTGVKLKRVKGDLWVYKEYCQRLMAKMRL